MMIVVVVMMMMVIWGVVPEMGQHSSLPEYLTYRVSPQLLCLLDQ